MHVITTIGPNSWSPEFISSFIDLGVQCIRFPFAKEKATDHIQRALLVQRLSSEQKREIKTIADLPGGKPRLCNTAPIDVSAGHTFTISIGTGGAPRADLRVEPPFDFPGAEEMTSATIGDGENEFIIKSCSNGVLTGNFARSGCVERHRAFIPRTANLKIDSFTDRDRQMARAAQAGGFNFVALSFVDSASVVHDARSWLATALNWRPKIISKIETLRGVEKAGEIAEASDAVMIARGDLAVQVGLERLWDCQRMAIQLSKERGAYVIVGTGFLESMARNPFPSRAEAVDVLSTLSMGADALMLSAETTIGTYPQETVAWLRRLGAQARGGA